MNGKHPNGILTYTAASACDKGTPVILIQGYFDNLAND